MIIPTDRSAFFFRGFSNGSGRLCLYLIHLKNRFSFVSLNDTFAFDSTRLAREVFRLVTHKSTSFERYRKATLGRCQVDVLTSGPKNSFQIVSLMRSERELKNALCGFGAR